MKMINDFFRGKEAEARFLVFLFAGLAVIMLVSYITGSQVERKTNSVPSESVKNPFNNIELRAKAAYVYDIRTKEVLYAKNENERLALASLTKLMSALVATDFGEDYTTITIDKRALSAEGDSGLLPGEKWSLKDLLDFSLISSSNDGIRAIALAFGSLADSEANETEIIGDFVRKMNKKAGELDLKNTYYRNDTGLDETEVKGGAYGSAKDIAALMEYIILYKPALFEATRETSVALETLDEHKYEARNTNVLAGWIPGLLGSKTGFTNAAGGNLALVFDPELGRPITVVVLGSTERGRFDDAKALIDATMEYINSNE